jgi:hypothetical protein
MIGLKERILWMLGHKSDFFRCECWLGFEVCNGTHSVALFFDGGPMLLDNFADFRKQLIDGVCGSHCRVLLWANLMGLLSSLQFNNFEIYFSCYHLAVFCNSMFDLIVAAQFEKATTIDDVATIDKLTTDGFPTYLFLTPIFKNIIFYDCPKIFDYIVNYIDKHPLRDTLRNSSWCNTYIHNYKLYRRLKENTYYTGYLKEKEMSHYIDNNNWAYLYTGYVINSDISIIIVHRILKMNPVVFLTDFKDTFRKSLTDAYYTYDTEIDYLKSLSQPELKEFFSHFTAAQCKEFIKRMDPTASLGNVKTYVDSCLLNDSSFSIKYFSVKTLGYDSPDLFKSKHIKVAIRNHWKKSDIFDALRNSVKRSNSKLIDFNIHILRQFYKVPTEVLEKIIDDTKRYWDPLWLLKKDPGYAFYRCMSSYYEYSGTFTKAFNHIINIHTALRYVLGCRNPNLTAFRSSYLLELLFYLFSLGYRKDTINKILDVTVLGKDYRYIIEHFKKIDLEKLGNEIMTTPILCRNVLTVVHSYTSIEDA